MDLEVLIAIDTPAKFHFICNVVSSDDNLEPSTYHVVPLKVMIAKVIAKFPGNLRDLSDATGIDAVMLSRTARDSATNFSFYFMRTAEYPQVTQLIKLYYKHVLAVA